MPFWRHKIVILAAFSGFIFFIQNVEYLAYFLGMSTLAKMCPRWFTIKTGGWFCGHFCSQTLLCSRITTLSISTSRPKLHYQVVLYEAQMHYLFTYIRRYCLLVLLDSAPLSENWRTLRSLTSYYYCRRALGDRSIVGAVNWNKMIALTDSIQPTWHIFKAADPDYSHVIGRDGYIEESHAWYPGQSPWEQAVQSQYCSGARINRVNHEKRG